MEHDQSQGLILQLLLEDLDHLENKQKGKQAAGKRTDFETALMYMRDEVMAAQNSIEDGILALSTSTAIATDQNLLASIRHDERIAEQDRRYALALDNEKSNPQDVSSILTKSKVASTDENEDAISVVIGDLMGRMTLNDGSVNGEGSSRHIASSKMANLGKDCDSCFEKCDVPMFAVPCGHKFCRDCTRQMFLGAIKDEELYPPRCCSNIVPPGIALRVLSYDELRAFGERAIEWTTKDRLYCAEPTCSRFIPPFAIQDDHGTCLECHQQTHLPCRSFAHPGVDCPMDGALHSVLAMADAENWRRCFNCRTMVELQHGCNHITCR
ncbi:E3 ubiquitin-protein ligase [Aspergillus tanneri]|nr:uncharacterized protein ATNIH1004_003071 [Aspergillus tanneri]KAA8650387.1 hypothetical protein ATNIH1004_003071 [Aspergillus tanneri]